MNKIEIISNVEGGQLKRNRKRIAEAVRHFDGKEVVITIERKRRKRSNEQNRYYWGVVIPLVKQGLADSFGEMLSIDTTHEFLKSRYLAHERVNEETGEVIRLPKSTTECSTTELEEYLMQCREFASEWLGITIPLPNEQLTID